MALFFLVILVMGLSVNAQLRYDYYSSSCPEAEEIVRSTVESYFNKDPTIAAGLLRLHFHDCFVLGCDASILTAGPNAERAAPANVGLRGFEVIEDAKDQLEHLCPDVVSCADILALAARDAVDLSDGPSWSVPTGRLDGTFSLKTFGVAALPSPFDSVDVQLQKFADKGLDAHDLVTLVGAHTIGQTDCLFVSYRLYNFNGTGNSDQTIDPEFTTQLQTLCPKGGDDSKKVTLDKDSQANFDVSFYRNVRDGNGVLESDQRLWGNDKTRDIVLQYAGNNGDLRFRNQFAKAMVKLSTTDVRIGRRGWIRKKCSRNY